MFVLDMLFSLCDGILRLLYLVKGLIALFRCRSSALMFLYMQYLDLTATGGRPPRKQRYKPQLTAATYRYFIRGQSDKAAADDYQVSQQKRIQLKAYDKLLKSFQYREALDAAIGTGRPEIVSSIVEELAARSGLPAALGGLSCLNPCVLPLRFAFQLFSFFLLPCCFAKLLALSFGEDTLDTLDHDSFGAYCCIELMEKGLPIYQQESTQSLQVICTVVHKLQFFAGQNILDCCHVQGVEMQPA